jgi:16S rRNA (adenine1518-N6/adenine1519-N6)-dimethyltransferase
MIDILQERFSDTRPVSKETGLKIFHQDILTYAPEFQDYSVVANIPYYITSPILSHFLYTLDHPPKGMLILMQRDVGDKILQGTGTKVPVPKKLKSSVISLMIAKKCFVSEKLLVPAKSFIPVPKVESSVLYFETHEKYTSIDDEGFLKFIKI